MEEPSRTPPDERCFGQTLDRVHDVDAANGLHWRAENFDTPTLVLSSGADPLLNTNLDDYRRLPCTRLQVFFRVGIHEAEGVAEAIHQFMQLGALNA